MTTWLIKTLLKTLLANALTAGACWECEHVSSVMVSSSAGEERGRGFHYVVTFAPVQLSHNPGPFSYVCVRCSTE